MAFRFPDELARLIPASVAGDRAITGHILKWYRDYLTVLVRIQIGRRSQQKVDAADVVRDVFLDAHRQFSQFRGTTGGKLCDWLRTLLTGHIAALVCQYCQTQAWNAELERGIEVELYSSS